MFGFFQRSQLRIEVAASGQQISDLLMHPDHLNTWLWPPVTGLSSGPLAIGTTFARELGPFTVHHRVAHCGTHDLQLILWGTIDGYHEWCWGEGWVQSRLEGVSMLPLNMGQTLSLLRLREFIATQRE